MTDQIYSRPYLESSVFIAFVKGEVVSGVDRGQIAQAILDDAASGRWPIFTSTSTPVEVLRARRQPMLTSTEENQVDAFFKHEYIKLVTLDRRVAEEARRLARQYILRPADAVHLASAVRAKADQLLTWDDDFPRTTVEGVRITDPYWLGQTKF